MGDRVMKVDHAGEHGAVCVYRAQRWFARWRAPEMITEIDDFIAHECEHRRRFGAELDQRNRSRCRSYHMCGLGGFALGIFTGLAGRHAISATTVAIERVVLRHMSHQIEALTGQDPSAVAILNEIILEEQQHHDISAARLSQKNGWRTVLDPLVTASTEAVIWMGMRL